MQKEPVSSAFADEQLRKGEYTISDLARLYGVSLRTLRFYEDRGLLQPRRQATARFYSAADRVRLELIMKGKRLGFTLAEISELIAARPHDGLDLDAGANDLTVSLDMKQVAAQIAHLEQQRSELNEAIGELRRAYERMSKTAD